MGDDRQHPAAGDSADEPTMMVTIRPMWRFMTKRAAKPARPPITIQDKMPMLPPWVVIRHGIATTLVSGQGAQYD
jgi:hypothetical protein